MSGQWEQYVEPAARSLDPDPFDEGDPGHSSKTYEFRREIARNRVRRVLAATGPLIAEDTRARMVAAAARAVEREGACSERAENLPPDGCTSTHPMASHINCVRPLGHPGDHASRNGRNWRPQGVGSTGSS